jgi:hypothetical protein
MNRLDQRDTRELADIAQMPSQRLTLIEERMQELETLLLTPKKTEGEMFALLIEYMELDSEWDGA